MMLFVCDLLSLSQLWDPSANELMITLLGYAMNETTVFQYKLSE